MEAEADAEEDVGVMVKIVDMEEEMRVFVEVCL